ncbi:MAG: type II secretion system F family protein [Acidimicrobiales bacterium]|nr:type II secretion system F family protein [Acidimicrobiales bacterium]
MSTAAVAGLVAGALVVAALGPARHRAAVAGRSLAPRRRLGPTGTRLRRAPVGVGLGLVATSVVVVGVVTTLAVGLGVALVAALGRRRASSRRRGAIERELPELIDLFVVAASAGLPVALALEAVAPRAPPALRNALRDADRRRRRGLPLDAVLDDLAATIGRGAGPLIDALRRASRTGAPLVAPLRQVSASAREQRRRHAETAARRLPVTLLLPLAGCILPAAILLAVVPVLLVSLASLGR